MIDLERLRRARASAPLRDPSRDRGPGSAAFLGRVSSTPASIAVDVFCLADPQVLSGDVYQGAPVPVQALTGAPRAVMITGPILPAPGDYVVARRVKDRWVALGNTCAGTICVTVQDCDGAPLGGATVAITGPGGFAASATTPAGGVTCAAIVQPGDYTVTASKSGQATRTATVAATCGESDVTIRLYPPSFRLCVQVTGPCGGPAVGAAVTVSGGASGGGTTDATGQVCLTIDNPVTGDLTIAADPPAGSGGTSASTTATLSGCHDATVGLELGLAAGYICGCVAPGTGTSCTDPIPETLHYSDDQGSCTLTYVEDPFVPGEFLWVGQYTMTTTHGATPTYGCCTKQDSLDVPVLIRWSCGEVRKHIKNCTLADCATGGPLGGVYLSDSGGFSPDAAATGGGPLDCAALPTVNQTIALTSDGVTPDVAGTATITS